MSPFTVEVVGDEKAARKLRSLSRYWASELWPKVWVEVAEGIAAEEATWWSTQGEGEWAPLSPAYAAYKSQVFPGQPIMVQSGALRDSLTDKGQLVLEVSPEHIALGSQMEYAKYHEEGTQHMPRRPIMIPTTRIWAIIDAVVGRNIV